MTQAVRTDSPNSTEGGLTSDEARRRLEQFGPNAMPDTALHPWPCCTEASKDATAPSWNHLRNADEISLPEFTHSVERFDRDGNFGHTASVFARLQGISDDALVATD